MLRRILPGYANRWTTIVAALGLILIVASGCTYVVSDPGQSPAVAELDNFITYENPTLGIALEMPQDWIVEADPNFGLFLASDEQLMESDSSIVSGMAGMIVLVDDASQFGGAQAVEILPDFLSEFGWLVLEAETAPESIQIQGQDAARVSVTGEDQGVAITGSAFVIVNGERLAVAISIIPVGDEVQFGATVDRILHSIVVSEPAETEIDLSTIEGEVELGAVLTGMVSGEERSNWRLTGAEGDLFVVTVTPVDDSVDLVLEVYDAAGASALWVESADTAGDGQAEERILSLPADGDYTISIRGFAGDEGGYELAVTETALDPAGIQGVTDLIGLWESPGSILEFQPDGAYRIAETAADLETDAFEFGRYELDGNVLTLHTDENSVSCSNQSGAYEVALTTDGLLILGQAEDECTFRGRFVPGTVLHPTTQETPVAAAPQVRVEFVENQLNAPEEWPAGVVAITYHNGTDSPVYADLARLEPGSTMADFQAVFEDPVAALELVTALGGPLVAAQSSGQAIYDLEPGDYVVLMLTDSEETPMASLTVVTSDNATPRPQGEVVAELRDFTFILPDEIQAGPQLWQISNGGEQWHHMAIVQLNEGVTTMDLIEMLMSEEEPEGPPPLTELFLWEVMEPGAVAWTTVDLPPGEYTVICFLPDFTQDPPMAHAAHGMIRALRVVQ